jgi:hypothetical protein
MKLKTIYGIFTLPFFLGVHLALPGHHAVAQEVKPAATSGLRPNIEGHTDVHLRYRVEGSDFVIENGVEFFNRPLYGGNTAFRVDGGDKPEFSLYLPGRGGNLRLGIKTRMGVVWLSESASVTTRYRPGELLYTISDPILGAKGRIELEVLSYHQTDGLTVRARGFDLSKDAELIVAFGGGNGQRGARDGDIGTERVPISQYFQFKPEYAADDSYQMTKDGFIVDGKVAQITTVISAPATLSLADATKWGNAADLLAYSSEAKIKIGLGRVPLTSKPVYISVQVTRQEPRPELKDYLDVTTRKPGDTGQLHLSPIEDAYIPENLAAKFDATRKHFTELRNRVRIETPDEYLNAAMGALNVATDATWDEPQGVIMHGSIAWRARLLGWRGPYALDALGWHDRARSNLNWWTANQNTTPIPDKLPTADEDANLARNETGLHSNGDLSNTHYDMNIGFFDAMFRHLLWTGDIAYAEKVWPVIERHLAWEKRLFRREFGPEKLPLYEAYASIWASDDIQYNGGGVTYQSAYNIYHNRMAARLATLLGKDPAPYLKEANLIDRAMRTYLWMPEKGAFAEFKDLMGDQLVHPSYGLWSFYHTMDSGVPNPVEAARMADDLMHHLKPIPIKGKSVPNDRPYFVLPTTNWMPYTWSLNNVVFAENLHTALGLWQAGRVEDAYTLTRGTLLASQYMGISPGNIGSMNYLDTYRREAQRDFADGAGVMSRAIIEGLFGVRPDALSGKLTVAPGFPREWSHAKLSHPSVGLAFKRSGNTDTWIVSQSNDTFKTLILELPAPKDTLTRVTVDGKTVMWTALESVGAPKVRIEAPFRSQSVVHLSWAGAKIAESKPVAQAAPDAHFDVYQQGQFKWRDVKSRPVTAHAACTLDAPDWTASTSAIKTEPVDLSAKFNDRVTEIFTPFKYRSPRSPFVSLAIPAQGIGAWAGFVNATANIDDAALRKTGSLTFPGGVNFTTPTGQGSNILFTSRWDNFPQAATVPLRGKGKRVYLLMAGSTNAMQSDLINGEVIVKYGDGTTEKLELRNPENWWPIERDYFIDDYQFQLCGKAPVRVDLKTGKITVPGAGSKGRKDREKIDGGAANVLDITLDPGKTLESLTVRTIANEVVIGLMGVSIER